MPLHVPLSSGPLDPIQYLGRPIVTLDTSGLGDSVYQIKSMERIPYLSKRGFVPLYCPVGGAATILAGYSADANMASGQLASGGSTGIIQPAALGVNQMTLVQVRFLLRFVGTLPASFSIDDIDLALYSPAAQGHWVMQAVQGYLSAAQQFPMPADANVGSLQGTNQPLPAAYPAQIDPMEAAFYTEFFIWGQNGPGFQLWNNASVNIPATQEMMIGLNISAIRYNCGAYPAGNPNDRNIAFTIGQQTVTAPDDTVIVPVAASPPQVAISS
jgi:hypothetical protein